MRNGVKAASELKMSSSGYVVVTGCLTGIGRCTLDYLCSQGSNIVACVIEHTEEFEAHCQFLRQEYDVEVLVSCFDISRSSEVKAAVQVLHKAKIPVVGLVNIAGVTRDAAALMVTEEDLNAVLAVNFSGKYN